MKEFLSGFVVVCFLFVSATAGAADQAYIKLGDAKAKKSAMAFPFFNNLGANNTGAAIAAASEIFAIA